jgi:hypothetical protein
MPVVAGESKGVTGVTACWLFDLAGSERFAGFYAAVRFCGMDVTATRSWNDLYESKPSGNQ